MSDFFLFSSSRAKSAMVVNTKGGKEVELKAG